MGTAYPFLLPLSVKKSGQNDRKSLNDIVRQVKSKLMFGGSRMLQRVTERRSGPCWSFILTIPFGSISKNQRRRNDNSATEEKICKASLQKASSNLRLNERKYLGDTNTRQTVDLALSYAMFPRLHFTKGRDYKNRRGTSNENLMQAESISSQKEKTH